MNTTQANAMEIRMESLSIAPQRLLDLQKSRNRRTAKKYLWQCPMPPGNLAPAHQRAAPATAFPARHNHPGHHQHKTGADSGCQVRYSTPLNAHLQQHEVRAASTAANSAYTNQERLCPPEVPCFFSIIMKVPTAITAGTNKLHFQVARFAE